MVIWGAIWGLVLGLLWPGHDSDAQAAIGAVAGAIAGFSLRRVVRAEIELQRSKWVAMPAKTAIAAEPDVAPSSSGAPSAGQRAEPQQLVPGAVPDPAPRSAAHVLVDLAVDRPGPAPHAHVAAGASPPARRPGGPHWAELYRRVFRDDRWCAPAVPAPSGSSPPSPTRPSSPTSAILNIYRRMRCRQIA